MQAKGEGLFSKLEFYGSGNSISFRSGMEVSRVRELVMGLMQEVKARPASPTSSSSVADEIKQLAELHGAGLVSDEEFEAKRKALLDWMSPRINRLHPDYA